ncbi:MAG: phosphopentomutase [Firmicutes bacterium]|nr:phosphopentomutase [Bacillota bacterium]
MGSFRRPESGDIGGTPSELISHPRLDAKSPVKRGIIVVLDGAGIGAAPDAAEYGDVGANTLGGVDRACGGLPLPNLGRLGLGNLVPLSNTPPEPQPLAAYGIMDPRSQGKDTISGHWELAGLILKRAFPTYPQGFPEEVIASFERSVGKRVMGNLAASGTEIIARLGPEHLRTGRPIVYTSADSVFQIAAHEGIIPVEELYSFCGVAREILSGEHAVARVIARPFTSDPGEGFKRTGGRRDFSLPPPAATILDLAAGMRLPVVSIGKVHDIFADRGFTASIPTVDNEDGLRVIRETVAMGSSEGIVFANLVDFDSKYGHRNDPLGYGEALRVVDKEIPGILEQLGEGDLLILTADHGCDPTFPGTDHTRESVPLLLYGPALAGGCCLGRRESFADLAATLADLLRLPDQAGRAGQSFAGKLRFR